MNKIPGLLILIFFIAGCKQNAVVHLQRKNIIETVYASGKIMADSEYTVFTLNPGTVIKKLVNEGDLVKKNQILYIINYTAPEAKLDAANILYSNARQNVSVNSRVLNWLKIEMQNAGIKLTNDSLQYMRLKNLWTDNIGTKSNLDNAEAQFRTSRNQKQAAADQYYATLNDLSVSLKNAQSQVATAQNDVNNYIIRAESADTVYQLMKEKGEAVKPNEAVALVGKSTDRVIRLSVDQQDIDRLKVGQEVLLKTDVTGDKIYNAKVARIYPVMNEADQSFRVDAVFLNAGSQPYIHSSVEANIVIQQKKNCLVISSQFLLPGDSLLISLGGNTKKIPVKTGIHTINDIEILGGIDEHADIVTPSQK